MNSERLKAQNFPQHTLGSTNSETFYLVDTKHDLNGCIVIEETLPKLACVLIGNKSRLTIEYDLFDENALIDSDGTQHEQCEAIFWPKNGVQTHEWTLWIEKK